VTGAQRAADVMRILVPLDGSSLAEQVIPYAQALAGESGEVVFLHVMQEPEAVRGLFGTTLVPADEVLQLEKEAAQPMLDEVRQRWQPVLKSEPATEMATGDPADVILRVAERRGCRLIAMASHGRGALGRLAFGSVTDRVARTSSIPVLVIRPKDEKPKVEPVSIRRIVIPHDGSELADEALPLATELATQLSVPVHVVRAVNPAAAVPPAPLTAGPYPAELYQQIADEMIADAESSVQEVSKRLERAGLQVTTAVVEGPAVIAIEDALTEGDLIVMTSHGRSGIARWLLGSVAEKLIRTAPVPVVLVPSSIREGSGGNQ